MNALLCNLYCCHIVLEDNVVYATSIICITILLIVTAYLICSYRKQNKRTELEKIRVDIENKITEHKIEQEKNKEKVPTETEKREKEFLDYCYSMAKSLEEGNEEQRNDCWEILLHIHADYIPDDLRQKYKGGKNVVENVGKKE